MHATYPSSITFTPETSAKAMDAVLSSLDAYTTMFNTAARHLYVDWIVKKNDLCALKKAYQQKWAINARQFNAMRIELQGKVEAVLELNKAAILDTENNIRKLKKSHHYQNAILKDLRKNAVKQEQQDKVTKKTKQVLGLAARLRRAESKHVRQLEIKATGNPRLCFGSKKLFRQQFLVQEDHPNHAQSVFATHEEWKAAWQFSRHRTFMLVGSHDETAGNQNCQLRHIENDRFELKVNLNPKAINPLDRYTTMTIQVHHGVAYIQQCLASGDALTYRFHKGDDGAYKVFISLDRRKQAPTRITMPKTMGVIGIDINAAHLSVAETDRFGNLVHRFDVATDCKGKTSDQAKNSITLAVKEIVQYAAKARKAIVVEDLDFVAKKKALTSGFNKKYNVMLSSFAYNRILSTVHARALDHGIEVISVNPAYTSVIGKYKYQGHRKLTTHQAAAYVIARRGMYSVVQTTVKKKKVYIKRIINNENPIASTLQPHYPFTLPVRNTKRTGLCSFWKAMASAEKTYRNKTCRVARAVDLIDVGNNVDSS